MSIVPSDGVSGALIGAASHPLVWHFFSTYWYLFTPFAFGLVTVLVRLVCCACCCIQFGMRCRLYSLIATMFLFVIVAVVTLLGVALFPNLESS